MAAPTLAWGKPHLFSMPDGSHLYGREFDLLPSGTMFAAAVILHGVVGVPATVDQRNVARIPRDAQLATYAIRGTDPNELSMYEPDVLEQYRLKSLNDVQG